MKLFNKESQREMSYTKILKILIKNFRKNNILVIFYKE